MGADLLLLLLHHQQLKLAVPSIPSHPTHPIPSHLISSHLISSQVMELMLKHGAEPSLIDKEGNTVDATEIVQVGSPGPTPSLTPAFTLDPAPSTRRRQHSCLSSDRRAPPPTPSLRHTVTSRRRRVTRRRPAPRTSSERQVTPANHALPAHLVGGRGLKPVRRKWVAPCARGRPKPHALHVFRYARRDGKCGGADVKAGCRRQVLSSRV
jgi:hypothetical protein